MAAHSVVADKETRPDRLPRGKRAIRARTDELNHPESLAQWVAVPEAHAPRGPWPHRETLYHGW